MRKIEFTPLTPIVKLGQLFLKLQNTENRYVKQPNMREGENHDIFEKTNKNIFTEEKKDTGAGLTC